MPLSNISPPPSNQSSKAAAAAFLGGLNHDVTTSSNTNNINITAYRPRLLYSALFTWNTITGGKFIAPFLQDLSPALFTDGVVGMTLAVQYAIVAVFAGYGGRWSDEEERRCQQRRYDELDCRQRRYRQHHHQQQSSAADQNNGNANINNSNNNTPIGSCWGLGRLKVLSYSILLGTCAILGHAVPSLYTQYYSSQQQHPQQHHPVVQQFPYELAWQISMRCIYALSLAIMAPCLDGLALAHLDCIDGASQADFGKERMYGAAFWGLGSLCVGVGMDRYGFGFLYVMTVVSAVLSYVAIGVYLVGLRRDTTGAFVTAVDDVVVDPMEEESSSSSLAQSSLLVRVGDDDDWNGVISYMDAEQRKRETSLSERNTSSSFHQAQDDETNINKTSALQLFQLICQSGYGKALLFFVFSLAVGISIVDNLAFLFFDTLGSSNAMNGLTVVFTVVSSDHETYFIAFGDVPLT